MGEINCEHGCEHGDGSHGNPAFIVVAGILGVHKNRPSAEIIDNVFTDFGIITVGDYFREYL